MATSGTYAFNPAATDFVLNAFSRIGFKRTELLTEHLVTAALESNLVIVEWANLQPNLWTSDLQSQELTQGVATYTLPPETVAIQIAYIETSGDSPVQDRVITPVSTTDYAAFPNKTLEGVPTVYWFNRQIVPQITLWQPPDGNATYTLKYQRVRQVQDVSLPNGLKIDTPYRFFDAFTANLAHRLSRHYKPELEAARKADKIDAWIVASTEDTEDAPISIIPGLTGYYR
jgi:hypothetical protein